MIGKIEQLRLYKYDGDFIELKLGAKTDAGAIVDIFWLPSGWFKVTYDSGKYATFDGFQGTSVLYSAPV